MYRIEAEYSETQPEYTIANRIKASSGIQRQAMEKAREFLIANPDTSISEFDRLVTRVLKQMPGAHKSKNKSVSQAEPQAQVPVEIPVQRVEPKVETPAESVVKSKPDSVVETPAEVSTESKPEVEAPSETVAEAEATETPSEEASSEGISGDSYFEMEEEDSESSEPEASQKSEQTPRESAMAESYVETSVATNEVLPQQQVIRTRRRTSSVKPGDTITVARLNRGLFDAMYDEVVSMTRDKCGANPTYPDVTAAVFAYFLGGPGDEYLTEKQRMLVAALRSSKNDGISEQAKAMRSLYRMLNEVRGVVYSDLALNEQMARRQLGLDTSSSPASPEMFQYVDDDDFDEFHSVVYEQGEILRDRDDDMKGRPQHWAL